MFEKTLMAPSDPILGLTEAFLKDSNPNKVNLGVGVYKDDQGRTPVFASVKKAEQIIYEKEDTKSYLPISGLPEFCDEVPKLVLGMNAQSIREKRVVTVQTVGGTSALRVFADLTRTQLGKKRIWLSEPTWENHEKIFQHAGFEVSWYPYYDPETLGISWTRMRNTLSAIPEGDILLLHGCCHNPTGIDLSKDQWEEIADIVKERRILPLIDFAYQGLGDGLEEDAVGIHILAEKLPELMVCVSFSKNFGLYNERCGALMYIAPDSETAQRVYSQMKVVIRTNYSNPPAHGAKIVATILRDETLRREWEEELRGMCARIKEMRSLLVKKLKEKGVTKDFGFIVCQKGMFSYTGLTKEQVETLKEKYAIYMVGSGRINVAGITTRNVDYLAEAIKNVL